MGGAAPAAIMPCRTLFGACWMGVRAPSSARRPRMSRNGAERRPGGRSPRAPPSVEGGSAPGRWHGGGEGGRAGFRV